MAAVANQRERRTEQRRSARSALCIADAVLRPGQAVVLVNINSRAALVESHMRLRPGAHTELQLAMQGRRTSIKGQLDRCHVSTLDPLRYRGVLVFEDRLNFED
jgi:hypothetical protein